MHTAQLSCKPDKSIVSDVMERPTIKEAKTAAKNNYEDKYKNNIAWKKTYVKFGDLLEVSIYLTT